MRDKAFGWALVVTLVVLFLCCNWCIPREYAFGSGLSERIWHSLGYGLFGLLLLALLRLIAPDRHILRTAALALLVGGLVAALDEGCQRLMPTLHSQVSDLRLNLVGLLIAQGAGLAAYLVVKLFRSTRAK